MLNAICELVRCFTGVQGYWLGAEPKTVQRIYFANHTSHFDCMVLLSVLPRSVRKLVRPAGAADYWLKTPIRRWFSQKIVHVVPIERLKPTKSNNPITTLVKALDDGSSLILFPEGTRNDSDTLQDFKSGLYHLCKQRPQVELIPTYINNANRILPKGECIPVPVLCTVTFGEPLYFKAGESRDEFLERAKQAMQRCAQNVSR
jgi:1-acyl-sn-glycerol-3-phosphate acyltransferase